MVVIMMMVMMLAGLLRRGLHGGPRSPRVLRRFQQRYTAGGAEVISFAILASTGLTSLPARVFRFRVHVHGFFRTLLQGQPLHRAEDSGIGIRAQPRIIHPCLSFPLGYARKLCQKDEPDFSSALHAWFTKVIPLILVENVPSDWKTPPWLQRPSAHHCTSPDDNARIALHPGSYDLRWPRRFPESARCVPGHRFR